MNFYIDPYILTIEKELTTERQLESFIDNLIDWKNIIDLNWGNVFKPADSFEILFKNNLYPIIDDIKILVNKYHIEYIQPEEIDKLINIILSKLPTIEDSSGIEDLLFDDNFEPENERLEDFEYLLKKMAILIQVNCVINNKKPENQIILTEENELNLIKFNTTISLIEPSVISTPQSFSIEISNFENFQSFCSKINPAVIWKHGYSETCIQMALNVKLFQITNDNDYLKNKAFQFHKNFYESLQKLGFKHEDAKIEMLLRTLTEDILDVNMQATHELRNGKGGNNDQIKFEGYSGWRRDIDYEYHLHYWRKGKSLIFTEVVTHNNFKISKF